LKDPDFIGVFGGKKSFDFLARSPKMARQLGYYTMKTIEKPHSVRRSGVSSDGISFGIKEEGLSHIFNVLRNQLYSNKILAVIREYSCNAYDAHIEAGNKAPFNVTCPTLLSPEFSVRDFGLGLSPSEVRDIYAFYGESTKRNSNELIGQLGLGSKSGFAYGENFVINSYHNGIRYSYNAFIDASKKGQILLMDEAKTSEHNGVEIVIPVKPKDIGSFKENILLFFKYFSEKPKILNVTEKECAEGWKQDKVILSGEGWSFHAGSSWDRKPSLMVMGNIAYPIDGAAIDNLPNVFHHDFIVHFGIGELEVSASRESLQFSSSTQSAIKKRFAEILLEIKQKITDKIAGCQSLFEAKSIYSQLSSTLGEFYRFNSLIKTVNWKNKNIQNDFILPNKEHRKYRLFEIVKSGRSERVISRIVDTQKISCNSWTKFYVDDTKHKFMSRLAHYVFNSETTGISRIYVIEFENDQAKKDFLANTEMEESELKYVSSEKAVKITYPSSSNSLGATPKASKHCASEFVFDFSKSTQSWIKVKSDCFIEKTVDLDVGGVYVYINKFLCSPTFSFQDPVIEPLKMMRLFVSGESPKNFDDFYITFPEVVCVKSETAIKIKDNPKWKSLSQYIADYIQKHWTDNQAQKIRDRIAYKEFSRQENHAVHYFDKLGNCTPHMADFLSKLNYMKNKDWTSNLDSMIETFRLNSLIGIVATEKPTFNLENELQQIYSRYPILKAVDLFSHAHVDTVKFHLQLQEKNLTPTMQ